MSIKQCMTGRLPFWLLSGIAAQQRKKVLKRQKALCWTLKPPSSHGGGRWFESGRAHCSFADQDALSSFWISELSTQLSTPRQTSVTQSLATLVLDFELDELRSYTEARSIGLARKSVDWIKRVSTAFWRATHGTVTKQSIDRLRSYTLTRYQSHGQEVKLLLSQKPFWHISQRRDLIRDIRPSTSSLSCRKWSKSERTLPTGLSPKKIYRVSLTTYIAQSVVELSATQERSSTQPSPFLVHSLVSGVWQR